MGNGAGDSDVNALDANFLELFLQLDLRWTEDICIVDRSVVGVSENLKKELNGAHVMVSTTNDRVMK